MDKSEIAVIVTAVCGLLTTLGVGFGRLAWRIFNAWLTAWQKGRDEDRTQTKEQTTAMLTLAHRMESMEKALDRVDARVERVSGVHDVPHEAAELATQDTAPVRRATPAKGVGVHSWTRGRTEPGG